MRPETIAVRPPCRARARARASALTTILLIAAAIGSSARADEQLVDFTIVRTDTLSELSNKVFASPSAWREVARLNGVRNPDLIKPGQILRVPLRLMRPTLVNGRLVSVIGDVRIGDSAAAVGAELEEGQTVQTGVSSSTVIELADGSRLKLPPSSLASLAESRHYGARTDAKTTAEAPDTSANMLSTASPADIPPGSWFAGALRVLRGSVEIFATKLRRAKPLEVITPTAVVGVRGTHYRVGLLGDTGASTHAEVLEGAVRFDVPVAALGVDLTTGLGATAGPDAVGPVVNLMPAPDLSDLPTLFERPAVRFSLAPETGRVRVQVATDESFDKTVRDQQFESGAEVRIVDLEDGPWHLRLRRVDDQGVEGYDGARSFVLKAHPEPAAPQLPRTDSTHSVGTVNFTWLRNAGAPSVRLQVAEDVEFTRLVIDRDNLVEDSLSVEMNAAAVYFWRLQSIRPNGDHGPFGDPQRFELRPTPGASTVERSGDGRSIRLWWSGRAQDRYQLQLASDSAFTNLVHEGESDTSQWVLQVPEKAGRYFFRYRTIEPDGFVSNYAETLTFDVPKNWKALWILLPLLLLL